MIVQITNDRGDLAPGQFNIHMPGAGVGGNPLGCTAQYGSALGGYAGVKRPSGCGRMPSVLEGGCDFMFGWYGNAPNPVIEYTRVQCPPVLVERTGCQRADDPLYPRASPAL